MINSKWNLFRSLGREKQVVESPEWRKPHDIVRNVLKYIHKGKALDIGAQYGDNSLFLAQNGFRVLATDIDGQRLGDLRRYASEAGLNLRVNTAVQDVTQGIDGMHDVIVATRTLNYLPREQALAVVENMKAHTSRGGLNVIGAVTKYGDFGKYPNSKYSKFLVDHDELKSFYDDWEILEYEEKEERFQMTLENVDVNVVASIIARKPLTQG